MDSGQSSIEFATSFAHVAIMAAWLIPRMVLVGPVKHKH